jgi:ABC-type spermidine/putrescine transport system permease subunit I
MTSLNLRQSTVPLHERILPYLLIAPPILILVGIILYPAVLAVFDTFTTGLDGTRRLTLEQYVYFFSDAVSTRNLVYSLSLTFTSVTLLFVVCFPIALYLRFSNSRLTGVVQVLTLFPLFVPSIVLANALIRFFSTRGTFETLLNAAGIFGYVTPYLKPSGAVLGLIWDGMAFTTLLLTAGLQQIDNDLLEAARNVGANRWQIFLRIILPPLRPAVVIVFTLNFIGIFGTYTLPYLLGPAAPEMMSAFMSRTFTDLREPIRAQTQAVISFIIASAVGYLYIRTVLRQNASERETHA